MRRALGLEGEQTRPHPAPPTMERVSPTNRPKRRFVADGEVPVVHGRLQRRDETAPQTAPTTNRLEAAELAARAEREAREKAERLLTEAQAVIHDLQTRLGHAQLAANDAQQAIEAERATTESLRVALSETEAKLESAASQQRAAEEELQLTAGRRGRRAPGAPGSRQVDQGTGGDGPSRAPGNPQLRHRRPARGTPAPDNPSPAPPARDRQCQPPRNRSRNR